MSEVEDIRIKALATEKSIKLLRISGRKEFTGYGIKDPIPNVPAGLINPANHEGRFDQDDRSFLFSKETPTGKKVIWKKVLIIPEHLASLEEKPQMAASSRYILPRSLGGRATDDNLYVSNAEIDSEHALLVNHFEVMAKMWLGASPAASKPSVHYEVALEYGSDSSQCPTEFKYSIQFCREVKVKDPITRLVANMMDSMAYEITNHMCMAPMLERMKQGWRFEPYSPEIEKKQKPALNWLNLAHQAPILIGGAIDVAKGALLVCSANFCASVSFFLKGILQIGIAVARLIDCEKFVEPATQVVGKMITCSNMAIPIIKSLR